MLAKGLNYAVTDRDDAAIESNFCHGVRVEGEVGNQREQQFIPAFASHLFLGPHRCRLASAQHLLTCLARARNTFVPEGPHKARQAASSRARKARPDSPRTRNPVGLQENYRRLSRCYGYSTIYKWYR